MKGFRESVFHTIVAALLISSAAIFAAAQTSTHRKENVREVQTGLAEPVKENSPAEGVSRQRNEEKRTQTATNREQANSTTYSYEFTQPAFQVSRILIEHDATGHGKITFERKNSDPIDDPLELSPTTIERLAGLWKTLRFMDSTISYQTEKQYPHLGTMRLQMKQDTRSRIAEFNWTSDKDAFALVTEYRRIANQAIFIFDITLARENQPLEAPKLMTQLEAYVRRNDLTDVQQLIPLLRELSTDERIPLMSRNSAARILKKIDK